MRGSILKGLVASLGVAALLSGAPASAQVSPAEQARIARTVRAAVLKSARPGIMLLRAQPGQDLEARSWLGGLPRMPAGLDWPVRKATGHPMSFLAQIDLSQLPPEAAAGGLPAQGVLWFFADVDDSIDSAEQVRVLYWPTSGAWPERAAPAELEPMYAEPPYGVFESGDPMGTLGVRQALSFQAVTTYVSTVDALPPEAFDLDDELFDKVVDGPRRNALAKVFGTAPKGANVDGAWLETLGSADWPQTGLAAEMAARIVLGALPPTSRLGPAGWTQDGLALRGGLAIEASDQAKTWRARRFDVLTPEERKAFQAWLRDYMARAQGLTKDKTGGWPAPSLSTVEWRLREAPLFVAYQSLAHGGAASAIVPPALRQPRQVDIDNPPLDQMLGHGFSVQSAPYENRDKVLLLQLEGSGLMWLGDDMMLHFWITPQDLAARRFDRVVPTYEGD